MNDDHMQFIYDIAMEQCENMKYDEIRDCKGLIGPEVWNIVPPSERRHVFGRPLAMLVAQGKLPLEFAGFNRKRHNLYRKIKK
jgi:hypothetical protein